MKSAPIRQVGTPRRERLAEGTGGGGGRGAGGEELGERGTRAQGGCAGGAHRRHEMPPYPDRLGRLGAWRACRHGEEEACGRERDDKRVCSREIGTLFSHPIA